MLHEIEEADIFAELGIEQINDKDLDDAEIEDFVQEFAKNYLNLLLEIEYKKNDIKKLSKLFKQNGVKITIVKKIIQQYIKNRKDKLKPSKLTITKEDIETVCVDEVKNLANQLVAMKIK